MRSESASFFSVESALSLAIESAAFNHIFFASTKAFQMPVPCQSVKMRTAKLNAQFDHQEGNSPISVSLQAGVIGHWQLRYHFPSVFRNGNDINIIIDLCQRSVASRNIAVIMEAPEGRFISLSGRFFQFILKYTSFSRDQAFVIFV